MTVDLKSYEARDTLRDGRPIFIRAIRPDDKALLQDLIHHLSEKSRYFRFFTPKEELTRKELIYFTEIDFVRHVALVASVIDGDALIPVGVGEYILSPMPGESSDAELSFAVEDSYHRLGIATVLLRHLTGIARKAQVREFIAYVLPENKDMLEVFAHSGLPMTKSHHASGVLKVRLSLA